MKTSKKKGISLIVLVITIIIMIILAAAVIVSLSSSDIVNKANEAKTKSDIANAKEATATAYAEWMMMSDDEQQADPYKGNFSKYAVNKLGDAGLSTSAGAYADLIGMKIGDYVAYKPATDGTTTSTKYREFDKSSWSETNDFTRQTNLGWKYAGTDDNGNVLLLSDMPTSGIMYLANKNGYLEGPTKLNGLCKELYSNDTYGEVRSINVEDVNRILDYTGSKGKYYNSSWGSVNPSSPKTIGEIEKDEDTELPARSTPDNTDIANYKVDYYIYEGTKYKDSTTPEYKLIFRDSSDTGNIKYWLASSCVYVCFSEMYAGFDMRNVNDGSLRACELFASGGGWGDDACGVRPIVTLKSNIQIRNKNEAGQWTLVEN